MVNATQTIGTSTLTNAAESGNNTETVVATLTGVCPQYPGMTIRLAAFLNLAVGTGTTGGTLRIRRQSLTGTLVSPANQDNQQVAASKTCDIAVNCQDTPGEGIFTYVVTYQGTGDTGVANFNSVDFSARWS